jgi:hypothetical protein
MGIEPISSRSQRNILTFYTTTTPQMTGFEPVSLISKTKAFPVRLHLVIKKNCLWRDLNPQKLNPKYSMFTIFITKALLLMEGLEPSN